MNPNQSSRRALWFIAGCVLLVAMAGEAQNVSVGVVLDMESWIGKVGLSCIHMSLSEFYEANPHYKTRIVLHPKDSAGDIVAAAAAALDLIKNNKVEAILGPTTSMQTNFVIKLAHKAHVPILTFTASTPPLASYRSPYFFRLTQTDSAQVATISDLVKFYNWRQVVLIYQDDEFGDGMLPYLIDALQDVNSRVKYRSVIDPTATEDQIGEELYKLMTMPTRVFLVHMQPSLAIRLFAKANKIGMMREGYAWILTDAIANLLDSMTSSVLNSMEGALGVKTYVPKSMELDRFIIKWKREFVMENSVLTDPHLDIFGLWAYDAARALAMAIEKTGAKNFTWENPNGSENLTDLQTLGVSQNGEKIGEALSKTKFIGLTGNYEIVNGQLQSAEFEIVNVKSNGGNRVGFWNPEKGLLSLSETMTVIWPGNTAAVPKGWDFQTTGKRLRIGVPVKKGYIEFMKVKGTEVEGYCKDVFDAAIATLPYEVPFDYIPFALPNGSRAGSYDDLIMQVYEGVYDGAVGDITIVANRSKYVDFTLPFTDSGVSMIVPTQANSMNRAWLFLKPLTLGLWITSLCFFVFMGFVVWILEHRINPGFRGPPTHQIGTSLWYSFCTMVFAQRETLISNLARFVVVIWFFVVFVLTQSYTASLTSLLTVQQLQPTITNINELLTKQSWVGYLEGSFVRGLLTSVGIKNLKSYRSPEELDKLLKLGGSNDGIDAAFDETPYIKLFLSKFPNKYITTHPTYKTDGFGFAFPIGSPLVADISRAVLNVTESKRMNQLQMKWFGVQGNSWSSIPKVASSQLNLGNFWGLFLIIGTASIISLLIYFIIFVHREQHTLRHIFNESSNSSIKSKIRALLKIYDKRDLTSYTFRKSNPPEVVDNKIQANHGNPVGTSPNSNYLLSPSNDSIHDTNHEFSRSEDGNPVGTSPNLNYLLSPSNDSIHDTNHEFSSSDDLNPSNQAVEMVVHTTMEIVPQS